MTSIINSTVPEFKVQAYHNGKFVTVTNEDLKGKWAIFFFYPADFTFVCPTELVDMADKYDRFKAMGVEVYSVSTDTHFVHKAWHDTSESIRKINYPMLADPTGVLSRGFGVMIEEEGVAYRGTFVVNPEGKVKLVEIQDNSIGRNAEELLRKVAAAQFVEAHPGEVCPAKWQQGAETLKPSIDLVGKISGPCWIMHSGSSCSACSRGWKPPTCSTSRPTPAMRRAESCSSCSKRRPPVPRRSAAGSPTGRDWSSGFCATTRTPASTSGRCPTAMNSAR